MPQFDYENLTKQIEAIGVVAGLFLLTPPSILTGAIGTATVAVPNLTPDHRCQVFGAGVPTNGVVAVSARCLAPNVLTVYFANPTAGTLVGAAMLYSLVALPGSLN